MRKLLLALFALALATPALAADNYLVQEANGNFKVLGCTDTAGVCNFNVNSTPASGTTSDVNIKTVNGATTSAFGNGASGSQTLRVTIANDSTGNIATIGTSVTPGVAAANLGKAEDSVHATADTGVFALGVANVAQTTLAADGDYIGHSTDLAGNSLTVGNVAAATTDSGNPVKIGAVNRTTKPTYTDGQRGDLQIDTRGNLQVVIYGNNGTNTASVSTPADGGSLTASFLSVRSVPVFYNGSTVDMGFTCPLSAVISVTAGNTTELVALTASQVIRVCSFAITESLAGSAQFVYGTGTNCGTGTTNLTGAMALATSGSMAISGMNGSLFRTASANALCLAAVTGNITGFVTYAKY